MNCAAGKKQELIDRLVRAEQGESLQEDLSKTSGKSVNDLKAELEALDLRTSGSKSVLEARLERAKNNTLEDKVRICRHFEQVRCVWKASKLHICSFAQDKKAEKPSRPNAQARGRTRLLGRAAEGNERSVKREIARRRADLFDDEDETETDILKSMEDDDR